MSENAEKAVFVVEDATKYPCEYPELAGFDGTGWYFWDETQANVEGPFSTRDEAIQAYDAYMP